MNTGFDTEFCLKAVCKLGGLRACFLVTGLKFEACGLKAGFHAVTGLRLSRFVSLKQA